MSAEMRYDEAAQVILRDGVAVADVVEGKVRLRPEHKRLAIVVGKFWKGLCAPAAESAQPVAIPSPEDTVTEAGYVSFQGDVPPMPPIDPMLGTKTPAVVEWYRTYKPEEWANMHKGWINR